MSTYFVLTKGDSTRIEADYFRIDEDGWVHFIRAVTNEHALVRTVVDEHVVLSLPQTQVIYIKDVTGTR